MGSVLSALAALDAVVEQGGISSPFIVNQLRKDTLNLAPVEESESTRTLDTIYEIVVALRDIVHANSTYGRVVTLGEVNYLLPWSIGNDSSCHAIMVDNPLPQLCCEPPANTDLFAPKGKLRFHSAIFCEGDSTALATFTLALVFNHSNDSFTVLCTDHYGRIQLNTMRIRILPATCLDLALGRIKKEDALEFSVEPYSAFTNFGAADFKQLVMTRLPAYLAASAALLHPHH